MNDFGIKNMDQVAPVANSFRGTLKVCASYLNYLDGFRNYNNQEKAPMKAIMVLDILAMWL
jgi:hypothetical protein